MLFPYKYRRYFKPLLVVLTMVVYGHTFLNDFVLWDDPTVIVESSVINNPSLSKAVKLFFQGYEGTYRPVTHLVSMLISAIFGVKAWAYHGVSLLLHILTVLAVFKFTYILSKQRWTVAAVASLLFALHPMNVESVAWASALNDTIAGLLFFTALYYYTCYVLYQEKGLFWVAFLLGLAGMLAKPTIIVLPIIMLLIDWYLNGTIKWKQITEKWLFFLFSILVLWCTIHVRIPYGDTLGSDNSYTIIQRLLYPLFSVAFYLVKYLFPMRFSPQYTMPDIKYETLPTLYYLAPIFIALVLIVVLLNKYKRKEVLFGTLFFLITISTSIHLIPFGKFIVAERYTYLAYVGFGFIIGVMMDALTSNRHRLIKQSGYTLFSVWILFLIVTSAVRVVQWRDTDTLFSHAVKHHPEEPLAWMTKSTVAYRAGDMTLAETYLNNIDCPKIDKYPLYYIYRANIDYSKEDFELALTHYEKALSLSPRFAECMHGAGNCHLVLGDTVSACTYWKKAKALKYNYANELIELYCN